MKSKGNRIAKRIFKKIKGEGIPLYEFKAYYITTVIRWYWQRNRQINKREQNPEIKPQKYAQ